MPVRSSGRLAWMLSLIIAISVIVYVWYIATPTKRMIDVDIPVLFGEKILLPLPRKISGLTVEEAILLRRSIRDYTDAPVDLRDLAMILWASYGVTDPRRGFRSTPSAGATYPLEIYVVIGEKGVRSVEGFLLEGIYRYEPHSHSLLLVKRGDYRMDLMDAALGQSWVGEAPLSIVICAVFERTTSIYGGRGEVRYVPMEAGHAGQNIYLMATALRYGAVVVGAFRDGLVARIIDAKPEEKPLYIVPIGVPETLPRTSFEDIWEYIVSRR
ncbi:MAG: SagB/ThcOx family dehydrogenase [Nitrososphaerota archaeon]|nr:SagB/ThcOx family dehydrogenase [Candidatus Bathyarchaeota archaeon]MDW8062036.1 SagB/ThcOx family dehydrogenase [Nitrososphaerota archaeon]